MSKPMVRDQMKILTDLGFVYHEKLSPLELMKGRPKKPCVSNYAIISFTESPTGASAITTEGDIYRRDTALSEAELSKLVNRGFADTTTQNKSESQRFLRNLN